MVGFAGGLHDHAVAFVQSGDGFRGDRFYAAIGAVNVRYGADAIAAAGDALGGGVMAFAVRAEANTIGENFIFVNGAEATVMRAGTARIRASGGVVEADGGLQFDCLGG